MLVGPQGYIWLHLNVGSVTSPRFSAGAALNASDGSVIYSGDSWSPFTLVDMDGDGVLDLVLSDFYNRLAVYKNTAKGTSLANFSSTPYYIVSSVTGQVFIAPDRRFDVGDWNRDGFPDVVTGAYCADVKLFLTSNSIAGASAQ